MSSSWPPGEQPPPSPPSLSPTPPPIAGPPFGAPLPPLKWSILIVSTGTLLLAGVAEAVGLASSAPDYLRNADVGSAVASVAFFGLPAIIIGIMSAVYARRLRHPGWSMLWALVTLLGVVSWCSAVGFDAGRINVYTPIPPDQLRLVQAEYVAPVVVLPLAALLSVFLLRPGKPAEPTEPPPTASPTSGLF